MNRESITRIEMTDEEWIAARKPKIRQLPSYDPKIHFEEPSKEKVDEPQKNKVAKKKPAKIYPKSNKATVAGIQKKS